MEGAVFDVARQLVRVGIAPPGLGAIPPPADQRPHAGAALVVCEASYVERIAVISDGMPDVKQVLARGTPDTKLCGIIMEVSDLIGACQFIGTLICWMAGICTPRHFDWPLEGDPRQPMSGGGTL